MAVSISETISYKRLVAVGNNDVYYEDIDVAGTMLELDTSGGAIDTSDNLNMFELLQKVFIVNGANLKVADFVNTKLTVTALTTAPTQGSIITQATSAATMVVDFVNAAKTEIYGYVTSGTFVTTGGYTLSGGSMDPATRVPSAVTAKPHWYSWTKYPGSTTSLPNKAYLGCNYRGRPVLSGDPEHPHQWYMGRQLNPWDFTYTANDAQSPVAGGNADAGEIGDVIRALIPYKDDYLIFGCATTMWFIAGDPAEGGSINELDLTVGIFGANSWCFDGKGYLYFFGTNGIYKTTIPGTPECVSEIRLPKLIKDEAIDPSTHRITMAYDRTRVGILVCITKLSDGSNSDYWYDLQTGGFFPESYADECGAYSSFFYGANDPDYRDLLVGCKDGYIRKFNESLKSDNDSADAADVGTVAIDSYVGFGPLQISKDPKYQGRITGLDLITAGGASGGSESDSSDITCKVFTAKSAEEVVEKLYAGTTPNVSKIFKAPGRQHGDTMKQKIKGVYAGIELRNSTAAQSWGFEQLLVTAKPAGRMK